MADHDGRRPGRVEFARQAALIVVAALVYFAVRSLTEGSVSAAVTHGREVLRAERAFGIDVEAGLQTFVTDHHWLTTLVNWIYIWGHWPVIALTFVWLFRTNRSEFYLLRNAMFVSGAIGIVIFACFPVAPPRLLPGSPYVDTVTTLSRSYRVLQPPALVNKYAAMPSLHAGWNLLVGISLHRTSRSRRVRALGVASPALMTFAVVATANHYVLDPVVGGAVALVGFALAWWWSTRDSSDDPSEVRVAKRAKSSTIRPVTPQPASRSARSGSSHPHAYTRRPPDDAESTRRRSMSR